MRMHKAKYHFKNSQIVLNKAKFYFIKNSKTRTKFYQFFRHVFVKLISRVFRLQMQYVNQVETNKYLIIYCIIFAVVIFHCPFNKVSKQ